MIKVFRWLPILLVALLAACESDTGHSVTVQIANVQLLKNLPSGSGMFYSPKTGSWVVGDDSPELFCVDTTKQMMAHYPLYHADSIADGRVPSRFKYDFEAIAHYTPHKKNELLIFGSGSWSPMRDTCLLYNIDEKKLVAHKSIRALLDKMIDQSPLGKDSLRRINIEGAAIIGQTLYMAHRGGDKSPNVLFSMLAQDFVLYLTTDPALPPAFEWREVELPAIDGFKSGFSSLAPLSDTELLFTASVEASDEPPFDGKIMGSFVGILPLDATQKPQYDLLHEADGSARISKLESISLKHKTDKSIFVQAVSDNDNGTTELFELVLEIR